MERKSRNLQVPNLRVVNSLNPSSKLIPVLGCSALSVMMLAISLPLPEGRLAAQQHLKDQNLLQRVSQDHGIPMERLQIGDRVSQDYPYSGAHIDAAKVLDTATGEAYLVAVDARGNSANMAAAESAEANASLARFGKIDPSLHGKLSAMREDARLPVSLWLNIPDPSMTREASAKEGAEVEAAEAAHQEALGQYMAPRRQPVLHALANLGVKGTAPKYAPIVFAELNRHQIEAISRHPDVSMVYGPEEYKPMADDAGTTDRVNSVWNAGNLGSGANQGGNVKPVNWSTGAIDPSNTYLNNPTHPVLYSNLANMVIGSHATQVAGVIASIHSLYRGIAPSAQAILNANSGGDPNLTGDAAKIAAYEWAHDQGGDPINFSFGGCTYTQTTLSRYVDWATRNLRDTFLISSGNSGNCGGDQRVTSPAHAWSVIAVGNFSDKNNGWWSDDAMANSSCWKNPDYATSMEKPEVVAVGTSVMTTDLGAKGITASAVSGTSYSAPQVAGQVALMLARKPGQEAWPETNKAAVLASAWHDLEGGLLDKSRDGVGGVVIRVSDDTYRLNRFINDCKPGSCAPLTAGDFPRHHNDVMSLTAGQKVRVAMAYTSWSTGPTGTDQLGADLDLAVYDPNGNWVASSASAQNTWEMVEFTAPVTGAYDIRINLINSSVAAGWPGTYVGIAWSIQSIPTFCTDAVSVPNTGGTFLVDTANGTTFFDTYPGWGGASQTGREKSLRLGPSSEGRNITVTLSDDDLDLHILQVGAKLVGQALVPDCSADPFNPLVLGQGSKSVSVNLPAGLAFYFIVVDGPKVDNTNVTVSVTGP
jgi:hypothetical protein